MRILMLSAILACGLGFAATTGSQAAGFGAGINEAAQTNSAIEQVQYRRCRMVRSCRMGPYGGRRCRVERICRGGRW